MVRDLQPICFIRNLEEHWVVLWSIKGHTEVREMLIRKKILPENQEYDNFTKHSCVFI